MLAADYLLDFAFIHAVIPDLVIRKFGGIVIEIDLRASDLCGWIDTIQQIVLSAYSYSLLTSSLAVSTSLLAAFTLR